MESTIFADSQPTVHRHIPLSISFEELESIPTFHCRGYMRPKIARVLRELLTAINTEEVLLPAASYHIVDVDVDQARAGTLRLVDSTELCGPLVAHKIKRASMVMATVTTLGARVGEMTGHLFASGKRLNAVLLEEIANRVLFKLNEQLLVVAREEAGARGLLCSGPLCPGSEGFDLQEQSNVLHLADAGRLGVELSRLNMMMPRHSHTQLVGFGKRMKSWGFADNCSSCKVRDRCPHFGAV